MQREGARPEIIRNNMGHVADTDVTQNVYGQRADGRVSGCGHPSCRNLTTAATPQQAARITSLSLCLMCRILPHASQGRKESQVPDAVTGNVD